jgi:Flp pilus assembly protein TadD
MSAAPNSDPAPVDLTSAQGVLRQATALLEQKRSVEAAHVLQDAVARYPANAEIRFAFGVALLESGDAARAAPVLLKASRLASHWLSPRLMLAKALQAAGRHSDALTVLRQTTQDLPHAADAWMQRGNMERDIGDNVAAVTSYQRYITLVPNDALALNNLGVAQRALNRFQDAIASYRKAAAIDPGNGLVHANLGNALDAVGDAASAEHHLMEAARLLPGNVDAMYNVAVHFVREEKPDEAVPLLRAIVEKHPDRWDAWTNLGVALVALGQLPEAEACYRAALQLWPSAPEAHYNLAWVLLLAGKWPEGWAEYEWRWQLPNFSSLKRTHTTPPWNGRAQPGKTILLHAEQGLGDTIQFVRFAKQVRDLSGRVIVEAPRALLPLLRGVDGVDDVVALGEPWPPHDFHAQLLGLPRLLDATPNNIQRTPYIEAGADGPALPASQRRKVGIAWAGSADNKIDRRRSTTVEHFAKLLNAAEVDVVSLQVGPRAPELTSQGFTHLVFDLQGKAGTWAETACVIDQLDLIITVDTAVAHLAGAMGKPTWILLPFSPDFRWLMGREDTPWYSSVRLFRQRVRGDWAGLFEDVRHALTVWIRGTR